VVAVSWLWLVLLGVVEVIGSFQLRSLSKTL